MYKRQLFPDVLVADRSAPRAAGTVVTRLGTERINESPGAQEWSAFGKHIEKTMVDPVVHPVEHPMGPPVVMPPFLSIAEDGTAAKTNVRSAADPVSEGRPASMRRWLPWVVVAIGFGVLLGFLLGDAGAGPTELIIHAPDGSTVVFDRGPRHHPGTLETTPGLHEVRVEKLGFEPFVQQVNLQEGTRTILEVGLTPRAP